MADLLHGRLEERRAIGRLDDVRVADRRLPDARAGLGVEALDRHAERLERVEQVVNELLVLALAHPGVAEHPRGERLEPPEALLLQGLRRLAEDPELELGGEGGAEPLALGAGR